MFNYSLRLSSLLVQPWARLWYMACSYDISWPIFEINGKVYYLFNLFYKFFDFTQYIQMISAACGAPLHFETHIHWSLAYMFPDFRAASLMNKCFNFLPDWGLVGQPERWNRDVDAGKENKKIKDLAYYQAAESKSFPQSASVFSIDSGMDVF